MRQGGVENRMLRPNGGFGNPNLAINIGLRKRASSILFAIKRGENTSGNLFSPFYAVRVLDEHLKYFT